MSLPVLGLVLAAVLCWPARPLAAGTPGTWSLSAGSTWRPARGSTPVEDLEALARVADLLAMALRSGATPLLAMQVVADQAAAPWGGVLEDVAERLASGAGAGVVWRRHAAEHPEIGALAGAWALSEDLGVQLAPSMRSPTRASCSP